MILKNFIFTYSLLVVMLCHAAEAAPATDAPPKNATLVYVGTYTDTPAKSKGIYLFWLRTEGDETHKKATLMPLGVAAETASPSFLTLDSKRRLLFCANETETFNGKPGGGVSSFAIDPVSGKLKLISQRSSMGAGPCQLVLDKTGKHVLVANYNSGNVAVFPVAADGSLGEATSVIQDSGKGPNTKRQEGPHAHCVMMSPDNKFAYVCDLGIDKVMIFKFDAKNGKLTENNPPFISTKPGSGPRHLVFHPNGKFAYVINELASSIVEYAYDSKTGNLKELQTVSSLPANYHGENTAAEIEIDPSGKLLFASNRGDDSVVAFAIDSGKGTLTRLTEQKTGGKTPRHFSLEPLSGYMAVCNQNSDNVLLYRPAELSDAKGHPQESSNSFEQVPSPCCVVFLPPNKN